MFQKKEIIFCETMGVCTIEDITKIPAKNEGTVSYYALSNVWHPEQRGYFPVETNQRLVLLRPLLTPEEAAEKQDSQTDRRQTASETEAEMEHVLNAPQFSDAEQEELQYVLHPEKRPQLHQEKKSSRMKSWRDLEMKDPS